MSRIEVSLSCVVVFAPSPSTMSPVEATSIAAAELSVRDGKPHTLVRTNIKHVDKSAALFIAAQQRGGQHPMRSQRPHQLKLRQWSANTMRTSSTVSSMFADTMLCFLVAAMSSTWHE